VRTAPYLFNLVAEVCYWILGQQFKTANIIPTIIHYLDDFLLALDPGAIANLKKSSEIFTTLCAQVALSIKTSKNEEGTAVSFAGLVLDTGNMVIQLPHKKLQKARKFSSETYNSRSLSLLDIQKLTQYPNFVSTVVPLGRTFPLRLYNMELYFPPQAAKYYKRRISGEAHKDLAWWSEALRHPPERSIATRRREVIRAWSDAASTQGLWGYYLSQSQVHPEPDSAFSIPMPLSIAKGREHINRQEIRTVEQVSLHWVSKWKGRALVMHVDNQAVAHGIANRTMRGASMQVLRRCLLLASEYDLEVEAFWVPTKENALAEALSRSEYNRIADLAPQLLHPTCSLQQCGFLTYRNRDCHG